MRFLLTTILFFTSLQLMAATTVSVSGISAWDALTSQQKERVKQSPLLYLHQSVGQDLEDGAESNGFKFEYYGPSSSTLANGPNGGIFIDVANIANGEPLKKIDAVRKAFHSIKPQAKLISFSFGYADIRDKDLMTVQNAYKKLVAEIKVAGARFVHVTPPLVFSPEENPPKQKMRDFMLTTFKDDVIFDLQDIESLDGTQRCQHDGVWRICPINRSTAACPSKSQGIDGEGAGHLCEKRAKEIAKAMLYSYYLALTH